MPPPNRTPASNTSAILLTVARTRVRDGLIMVTVLLLVASKAVKSMNVAWGNDYIYEYPGKRSQGSYDLMSMGPDGRVGGDDDIVKGASTTGRN